MNSQEIVEIKGLYHTINKDKVEFLRHSTKQIGYLYPVLIDKETKEIIDGRHRIEADSNWPKKEIDGTGFKKTMTDIHANWYRMQSEEKKKLLEQLHDLTKWKGLAKFEAETGIPQQTLAPFMPQGAMLKVHKEGNDIPTSELESQRIFDSNVWEASKERPIKTYGDANFHGNTPPLIAFEVIRNYTEEGNIVLDPMAGSGTLIDVCQELNRKVLAFDIKPIRNDIEKKDAEKIDLPPESVDFVFAHWPYWEMVKYSDNPDDLSLLSLDEFLEKSERIIKKFKEILKKNGHFALLIGNQRKSGKIIPLTAYLTTIGIKYFILKDWIVWIGKGQKSFRYPLTKWRAKKYKFYPLSADIFLIFKKVIK